MKKFISLLFIISVYCTFGYGQKESTIWYFGSKAGLSFANDTITVLYDSKMIAGEGCSAICNDEGELIFYTDGIKIWNKKHNRVEGPELWGHVSTSNSGIVVQHFTNPNKFYVFSLDAEESNLSTSYHGLSYSIVDMSLNGGQGKIVSANIIINKEAGEKMGVAKHANGKDIWIISTDRYKNEFNTYRMTSAGIDTIPVRTTIGSIYKKNYGCMKISPDYKKVIVANSNNALELYDFDNLTGKYTAVYNLYMPSTRVYYGAEFSPNNKYLYTNEREDIIGSGVFYKIYQYDITKTTAVAIRASKTLVGYASGLGALQLAPNKHIYVANYNTSYLDEIVNPDDSADKVIYKANTIDVSPGLCYYGLPTFAEFNVIAPNVWSSPSCIGQTTDFVLIDSVNVDSVFWDFGDTASGNMNYAEGTHTSHTYGQQNTYTVKVTVWRGLINKVYNIDVVVNPFFKFSLSNDTFVCNNNTIKIGISDTTRDYYVWSNGSNEPITEIADSGWYWLEITDEQCTTRDSIHVDISPVFTLELRDTFSCDGDTLILNLGTGADSYIWSHGNYDSIARFTQTGTYYMQADKGNCISVDSIDITFHPKPKFTLGKDTSICNSDSITIGGIKDVRYHWNTGDTNQNINVRFPGIYILNQSTKYCDWLDSIKISVNQPPSLNLGPDTTLCQDEIYQVNINSSWDKVSWSDGSNNFSRVFTTEGVYRVTAGYLNCEEVDTLQIGYHAPLPDLDLGEDKDVCDPLFYVLESSYSGYYSTQWQDGTKGNYYEVTKTGDYIISTLPHRCGQVSDTIHITFLRELCDLHIPNAFTPNGDGDNDYFFPVGYQMDVENMQIYNRWGELLYDGNQPWDGTYQGAKLPNGAYLYIITYKKEHRGAKKRMLTKGTVQILR